MSPGPGKRKTRVRKLPPTPEIAPPDGRKLRRCCEPLCSSRTWGPSDSSVPGYWAQDAPESLPGCQVRPRLRDRATGSAPIEVENKPDFDRFWHDQRATRLVCFAWECCLFGFLFSFSDRSQCTVYLTRQSPPRGARISGRRGV